MEDVVSKEFCENVKQIINESRKNVKNYVNTTMLFTYWNIGKKIVELQGENRDAKRRNKIINELVKKMNYDYGKGYEVCDLRDMEKFYLTFPIWESVRMDLSWGYYKKLLKGEDVNEKI